MCAIHFPGTALLFFSFLFHQHYVNEHIKKQVSQSSLYVGLAVGITSMCCIPRPKIDTQHHPHHQCDLVVDALSVLIHQQK